MDSHSVSQEPIYTGWHWTIPPIYPSQFRVNDALDAAQEMGLTVIRSHDVGISTGCPNCIEPSLDVFNETALEHVDGS